MGQMHMVRKDLVIRMHTPYSLQQTGVYTLPEFTSTSKLWLSWCDVLDLRRRVMVNHPLDWDSALGQSPPPLGPHFTHL